MRKFEELVISISNILNKLEISHFFTGAIATSYWGKPRTTTDIDIVWKPSNIKELYKELRKINLDCDESIIMEALESKGNLVILDKISPYRIDFLPPQAEQLKRRKLVMLLNINIWLVSPEDLIIMKVIYGREKDRIDIMHIIYIQGDKLDYKYIQENIEKLGLKHIYNDILKKIESKDNQ